MTGKIERLFGNVANSIGVYGAVSSATGQWLWPTVVALAFTVGFVLGRVLQTPGDAASAKRNHRRSGNSRRR